MATWSDLGVVAVSGGIGIAATYVGTRLQARSARDERSATEHRERVSRMAAVIGPIRTLLIDTMPARIMFNGEKLVEGYWNRWLSLRDQLEIAAVSEPDRQLRETMRQVEVQMANLFARLTVLFSPSLQQLAAQAGDRNHYDEAVKHHEAAVRLVEQILDSVHGGPRAALDETPVPPNHSTKST